MGKARGVDGCARGPGGGGVCGSSMWCLCQHYLPGTSRSTAVGFTAEVPHVASAVVLALLAALPRSGDHRWVIGTPAVAATDTGNRFIS